MFYHLWITINSPVDEGELIAAFYQKNIMIEAASSEEIIKLSIIEHSNNALLAIKLLGGENDTAAYIYDRTVEILDLLNVKYYSLIVSEYQHNAIWSNGNIIYQASKTAYKLKITN